MLSFCLAEAAAESLVLDLGRNSFKSPGLGGSISGAEFRPSRILGGKVAELLMFEFEFTVSRISVTEIDLNDSVGSFPDDVRDFPSVSSTLSKSADLGRGFLRVLKSIALLSILKGFRRPER